MDRKIRVEEELTPADREIQELIDLPALVGGKQRVSMAEECFVDSAEVSGGALTDGRGKCRWRPMPAAMSRLWHWEIGQCRG